MPRDSLKKSSISILFVTDSFPYSPGEQFVESEMLIWEALKDVRLIIAPLKAAGEARPIPKNAAIHLGLAGKATPVEKLISLSRVFSSHLFFKEAAFVLKSNNRRLMKLGQLIRASAVFYLLRERMRKVIGDTSPAVLYFYWNSFPAYAAVSLKDLNFLPRVYSRAHGYDLYEERSALEYAPLKRYFINRFDSIFPISEAGRDYLISRYQADPDRVFVSRLGVFLPGVHTPPSGEKELRIISVSYCVRLKRVDKIIDAIRLLAQKKISQKIYWTHIGGGPLLEDLKAYAIKQLSLDNVEWVFLGDLPNSAVLQFYERNSIDFFVNASESEGVPVTIMECMSYGIPAIAPNVGGVSELVSNENGTLLSVNPTPQEIANSLEDMAVKSKDASVRSKARSCIESRYCAAKNYSQLVELLTDVRKLT